MLRGVKTVGDPHDIEHVLHFELQAYKLQHICTNHQKEANRWDGTQSMNS